MRRARRSYPALARAARVSGGVVAGVAIGAGGTPIVETIQGHPLLTENVAQELSTIRFPDVPAQKSIFRYRLGEPGDAQGGSDTVAPNEWLTEAAPLLISDPASRWTAKEAMVAANVPPLIACYS